MPSLRILAPTTAQSQLTAGQDVAIFGTAVQPDAARYQIEYRPAGGRAVGAGWRAAPPNRPGAAHHLGHQPTARRAAYELRLTAVDRQNIPLPGMAELPDCRSANVPKSWLLAASQCHSQLSHQPL
jgi:hypothetical protein